MGASARLEDNFCWIVKNILAIVDNTDVEWGVLRR